MNISQNDTKKKIRDTALKLFSERGYEGVSVQDIAKGVGIKAPSLYKHYRSKKDIFMGIIEDAERRYVDFVNTIRLDNDPGSITFTPELLERKLISYVTFAIHDEEFSSLRKLLTIEQYSMPEAGELLDRIYVKSLFSYH
ncbi:MAG: TetR/AcrR family transcriptional regulator, partial [Bullifex sp.]